MKPSKKTRHKIYVNTLKLFIEHKTAWMCPALIMAMDSAFYHISETNFPEFFSFKPKNNFKNNEWFDNDYSGRNKRIAILKNCIEQTKP